MSARPGDPVTRPVDVSVVCPVGEDVGDLRAIHRELREILVRCGRRAEFLYVFDGPRPRAEEAVLGIVEDRFPVRIFRMSRGFGEATALQYGFEKAQGHYVLTVPAQFQVDLGRVPEILARLDADSDVVVTRRHPRRDPLPNRIQSRIFHWLIALSVGEHRFRDLTSGLRGLTATSARTLELYGDLHRFIPLLATRHGFRVTEIEAAQRREDHDLRLFRPGVYVRRLLDILNVLLLTRFTRKPLRFFGLVGLVVGTSGAVICGLLGVQRLLGLTALGNRPLLLLGLLLLILGIQLASIGLLAEIIIFHSARREQPQAEELKRQTSDVPLTTTGS